MNARINTPDVSLTLIDLLNQDSLPTIVLIESDDINKILNDSTRVGSLLEDSSPKEETSITPEVTKVKSPLPQPTAQMQTEDRPIQTLKELEYDAIVSGLERTGWNMTTTAQQLGISRMTLYRKLEQHGLRKKD